MTQARLSILTPFGPVDSRLVVSRLSAKHFYSDSLSVKIRTLMALDATNTANPGSQIVSQSRADIRYMAHMLRPTVARM